MLAFYVSVSSNANWEGRGYTVLAKSEHEAVSKVLSQLNADLADEIDPIYTNDWKCNKCVTIGHTPTLVTTNN